MTQKQYECHFDYREVSGGAIITEYDEDAPIVSVAEVGNITRALGGLLYSEIRDGAGVENARITIKIEEL